MYTIKNKGRHMQHQTDADGNVVNVNPEEEVNVDKLPENMTHWKVTKEPDTKKKKRKVK